jgi:pyruvate/2-oxoglutarate dehydrogenase complex dihydrolipoamide acyltransferase (E2) component
VTLPELGTDVLEAILVGWVKRPGDRVEQDEAICIVSSEDMRAAIASSASGRLVRLLAVVGAHLGPGASLAEIELEAVVPHWVEAGRDAAEELAPDAAHAEGGSRLRPASAGKSASQLPEEPGEDPEPSFEPLADPDPVPRPEPDLKELSSFHSPAVRRLSAEHGLDLSVVPGRGIGGRIRKEDVLSYLDGIGDPPPGESAEATAAESLPTERA